MQAEEASPSALAVAVTADGARQLAVESASGQTDAGTPTAAAASHCTAPPPSGTTGLSRLVGVEQLELSLTS